MTENKDPLNIPSSEGDDEFVPCDLCKIIFAKNDKKYGLLECFNRCHLFCPPCIQSSVATSSSGNQTGLSCPLCRLSETENEVEEQLWCSKCNVPASLGCYEESHTIQNYDDLYNALSLQLKIQINKTNSACGHTLIKCRQIQSAHQVILAWMQWLRLEISQWDSSNNATIAQLESLKISEEFNVPQGKELQCTINKINQLIAQFNDRYQEAQGSQLKVSQLLHTYSACSTQQEFNTSAQTSSVGSTELMKWFSTSFNQTNQSCINVLAFLISFLSKDDKMIKEEQDSNDATEKAESQQKARGFLKRRAEEDQESTHVGKKARGERSDQFEPDLSCDLSSRNNASSLAFKDEKELYYPELQKNHAEQLWEDRAATMSKEAEQNKDVPNRIARLEADLELMAKKIEQAKESEAKAHKEALNQVERAKETEKKYEMELKQHSIDVEQLKAAREQLLESKSQLATVLRELSNRTTPDVMEKIQRDKELLEKRLEQAQMELDEIKETREKSTTVMMKANAEFVTLQIKLQEEVRAAKEESQQLKSKLAETIAKHFNELHRFRSYKSQFEELKIEFDKLILEKEKCSANLAAAQSVQIKDQESAQNKAELEKAKPEMIKREVYHPCLSSTEQQIVPVVVNQQHPTAQHVTSTSNNPTKEHNVQNVVVPNVRKKIKQLQIGNFHAIASDMLAENNNNKDFDRFVYPCNNCKWPVETGLYCGECEEFRLCFLCHRKDGHHHKVEKFGFDLDRQTSPSDNKDLAEDRKSRIDRRILWFVHSFHCSIANCLEPFCRTMKEVVTHNLACRTKALIGKVKRGPKLQIRCLVCRQLVGLIISHAKHCTDPECSKPYCSNVKKKITNSLSKNNLPKPTKKVFPPPKKQGNPNLKQLGSRNKNPPIKNPCKAPGHNKVTVNSHSNSGGATAQTVKSYDAVGGTQSPTKSAGHLPRLQPAPFQQLNSIEKNEKRLTTIVTPIVNVCHDARQVQGGGVSQGIGEDSLETSNSMGVLPELQEIGKRDIEQNLQLNGLRPSSIMISSQNVTDNVGTQVNQVVHPVEAKKSVNSSMRADGEKRKTPQPLVNSIPQNPLTGKTMHLDLAIAMGGGICCPVGPMNRKALGKLLLDPKPFGCRFRATLKELLMEMKSPNCDQSEL